jgi:hypothetical protein
MTHDGTPKHHEEKCYESLIATLIELPSPKLQTLLDARFATFRLVNGLDRSHSNSYREPQDRQNGRAYIRLLPD